MTTLNITLSLDNAAFEHNLEGELGDRLLRVAHLVNQGDPSGKVFDSNGNTIGHFSVDEEVTS